MSFILTCIRKIGKRRFCLLLAAIVFAATFLSSSLQLDIKDLTELEKCPACFGVSACSKIIANNDKPILHLDYWGRMGVLINTVAVKNVYSGLLLDRRVIVKRLGHNSELQTLDDTICHSMGYENNCGKKLKEVLQKVPNLRQTVRNLLIGPPKGEAGTSLRLCPTASHMDKLFSSILPQADSFTLTEIDNDEPSANILTLLQINPEPLLLQIMRAEDGWPVPHYLGSCGRIAVMSDAGNPLLDFHQKPWPVRAGLALQLLLAADRFTYSHPSFAFYLLDVSPDNIAVSENGKLSFVDLEHVIVVDRHPPYNDIPSTWNYSHASEILDNCPGCYTFSPDDICSHHISDHNHFTICQQLLAPGEASNEALMPVGLLHSVPLQILNQYPHMLSFLRECASDKSSNRVRGARRLRDTLNIASRESPLFRDSNLMETWKYF